jgi:hypothetical protein
MDWGTTTLISCDASISFRMTSLPSKLTTTSPSCGVPPCQGRDSEGEWKGGIEGVREAGSNDEGRRKNGGSAESGRILAAYSRILPH